MAPKPAFFLTCGMTSVPAMNNYDAITVPTNSVLRSLRIAWSWLNTDAFTGQIWVLAARLGQRYTSGNAQDANNVLLIQPVSVGTSAIATETYGDTGSVWIRPDIYIPGNTQIHFSVIAFQNVSSGAAFLTAQFEGV